MLRPDIRIMLRITGERERAVTIESSLAFLDSLLEVTGGIE